MTTEKTNLLSKHSPLTNTHKTIEKKDVVTNYLDAIKANRGEKKIDALEGLAKHVEAIGLEITEKKYKKDPRTQNLESQQNIAYQKIKEYFIKEISQKKLNPKSFNDFKKYTRSLPKEELFPTVFLFYLSHFNNENKNTIQKSGIGVYDSAQGECDDASEFYDDIATANDLKGQVILMIRKETDTESNTDAHVMFFYETDKEIYVMDQQQYLRLNKDEYKVYSYHDVIHNFKPEMNCAAPIDPKHRKPGNVSEYQILKIYRNNCDYTPEKYLEKN